jgi:pilus assembly protein CpaF
MTIFGRRLHVVPTPAPAPVGAAEANRAPWPGPALPDPALPNPALSSPAPIDADPPAASNMAGSVPLQRLRLQVLERVDAVIAGSLPVDQLRAQIGGIVHELADRDRLQLSARDQGRLVDELVDEMVGFGPLETLLRDDRVDDILVNGPNRVFVEIAGRLLPSNVRFRDGQQLASIAQRMATAVPARRRIKPTGRLQVAGRQSRQRRVSAAGARRRLGRVLN